MIVYEVFEDSSFVAVDAACHRLNVSPYSYRSYLGTMQEKVWPLAHRSTAENGDLLLRRWSYEAEREMVLHGTGYDCNGWVVEMLVTRNITSGEVRYALARRLGYCRHIASQTYLLDQRLIDALPR